MSFPASDRISRDTVPTRSIIGFVLITLAISWGIAGAYIFLPNLMTGLFGAMEGAHLLYFLMAWGPSIAAVILVFRHGGKAGLRVFLGRLLQWRAPAHWWVLVVLGFPLIFMAGSLIKGGPMLAPMDNGLGEVLVIAVIMLFLGPVEEFGWRGFAQPVLQRLVAPFWTGALIGLAWGVWHLPAFYLSGTVYADWDFPLFLTGCTALGILVTPMFNDARGGLMLPVLFHWQLILPIWPDTQPWDTWIIVALATIVSWWNRKEMFHAPGPVTAVIPGKATEVSQHPNTV